MEKVRQFNFQIHLNGLLGTYVWANGSKYEGFWPAGKQHGQGKCYFPDGTVEIGVWENGNQTNRIEDTTEIINSTEDLTNYTQNQNGMYSGNFGSA